jgi:RNA polymerase sigma-70 factor, ECF subfamily
MCDDQERSKALKAAMKVEPARPPAQDLEAVFREHHALVFRAAYRITGNATDAEDVLQTVFLRLVRRPPEADTVDRIESYLHRAAINAALDLIRSRQSARSVPLDDVAAVLRDSSTQSPDRVYGGVEIRGWLRKAVIRLSPNAAEMFVLKFVEGRGNSEIAKTLGTTEGTVAVTVHRTRERISKELQQYLGGKS